MGKLIIANVEVADVDKLINWHQSGWDATAETCVQAGQERTGLPCVTAYGAQAKNHGTKRYSLRSPLKSFGWQAGKPKMPPLSEVQRVVKQFVLHHDGLEYAAQTFHTLQNERGLSCHFIVDNDGTIYQTLDLALCGFHASEYNQISIGVEMVNRGNWDAPIGKDGHYYDNTPYKGMHPEAWCVAHNSKVHCFDFTKEQYESMHNLAHALTKALPNIALDYPQDVPGHVNRTLVNRTPEGTSNAFGYSGYIGHLHLTTRKWDPGPFDFKGFIEKLRGSLCFPVWTGKMDLTTPGAKPQIPEKVEDLETGIQALYDANEHRAQVGFYPVGPWGASRLWHGGVHLPASGGKADPVYAPFPGRVVLARMGKDSAIGSVNFVLIRHDMSVGPDRLRFYSLYMHLEDELKEATPVPPWMGKDSWKKAGKKGEVVVLDEPIAAGEILGRFGNAGPPDDQKRQIHFEIFSKDPLVKDGDDAGAGKKWKVIDGSSGGRFSEVSDINDPIDTSPKDGVLSKSELTQFFDSSGESQGLHYLSVYSLSEWTFDPDWSESLRTPEDFRQDTTGDVDAQINTLVEEQITPGLWWDDDTALAIHLPRDGYVYHYHPVTFVQWINESIITAAAEATPDDAGTTTGSAGMSSDFDGQGGDDTMLDVSESVVPADNDLYDLGNFVDGFDGDPEDQ